MGEMVSQSSVRKSSYCCTRVLIFLLFNFISSFVKGFQGIPHIFGGLTMRYEMILINPKRGDKNILCLQIVLDLLFVIIAPIGFWLIFCYTVGNNLRLKPPVGHGVPHIHVHRLDVNAHAFFPIVVISLSKIGALLYAPVGSLLAIWIKSSGS